MTATDPEWLDQIAWNDQGLVPAIAIDHRNGELLMQAWMNRQALALSVAEGCAIYWSRSRQKLWRKGEESGHIQRLREVRTDCDCDAIVLRVEQLGDIACHTGRRSCFYRVLDNAEWHDAEPVLKAPEDIYGKPQ